MQIGLGMSLRQTVGLRQVPQLQLKILQRVQQTIITPDSICPKCKYVMSDKEIRMGWRDDPRDYTTQCPKCHKRFMAQLRLTEKGKEVASHPYLCRPQLFSELETAQRGKSGRLGMVFLSEKHPSLFWNMIRHFGTYDRALADFRNRN